MTNYSIIYVLLFLSSLFIVELSTYPELETVVIPKGKDRNLKEYFSKMQFIQGRKFSLGSTSFFEVTPNDSTLFTSGPGRRADVKSFYLSATEVTNSEWREFFNEMVRELGVTRAKKEFYPDTAVWASDFSYVYNKQFLKNYFQTEEYNDYPVVGITWDQAQSYCLWMSKKVNQILKQKSIKNIIEFRLPTEDEWEYAASRKHKSKNAKEGLSQAMIEQDMAYYLDNKTNIGQVFDINNIPLKKYDDDGFFYTSKVASFPSNHHGIYDMAGNVSEWTSDPGFTLFFKDSEFKRLSTESEVESEIQILIQTPKDDSENIYVAKGREKNIDKLIHDKKVLSKGDIKICKGGSWASGLIYTQFGAKQGFNKDFASARIGFRVALSDVPDDLKRYFPKRKWKR